MKRILLSACSGIVVPIVVWFLAMLAFTSDVAWLQRVALVPYMAVWGFYFVLTAVFPPPNCTLCVSPIALVIGIIAEFIVYSLITFVVLRWRHIADPVGSLDAVKFQT
jgi:hypothetical protein